jgi:hypothetical protein
MLIVLLSAYPAHGQTAAAGPDPASPSGQPAQPQEAPQGLNPTQEIAKETPEGAALIAGPTEIRIGGYLGMTGIYRSTNAGGGTGTSFGSVPYGDTLEGNLSEARLSAQSSRLSIRVNAAPAAGRSMLAGYFEMDFNGSTSGTVAVTSTGVGFRLRHAFGVAQYQNKYAVAAGQAFSLMTPVRDQLSIWPSEYEMSQAVDVNYLAGLVWARVPQVRFTYRPSPAFNWAISAENPEQQIGNGLVRLPACCADDLTAQFNTGDDALSVPNLMPDIVSRVAFNSGSRFHLDAGGVFRVFRDTIKPYADSFKHSGGGLSVNARFRPGASGQLIGQMSYGAGMGRYIGGLVPDVAISADGAIHPIRTASWIAGIEQKVGPSTSIALYDSGVVIDSSYSFDADGTYVGYGYPDAPNADNRNIHEITGVFAWQIWTTAGRGSMQWNTQASWLRRYPWAQGSGPPSASAFLFFTQIRYNLP